MLKTDLNAGAIWKRIAELRQNDINLLAPKFEIAVRAALADLEGRHIKVEGYTIPLDVIVFETARTNELQEIYYKQGTSNAKTAEKSWHFYGLAIDVISHRFEWFGNKAAKMLWPNDKERFKAAEQWFLAVGGFFEVHGCSLGAKWKNPDLPHIQWGKCKKSPVDAPIIYQAHGLEAVWRAVDAV